MGEMLKFCGSVRPFSLFAAKIIKYNEEMLIFIKVLKGKMFFIRELNVGVMRGGLFFIGS